MAGDQKSVPLGHGIPDWMLLFLLLPPCFFWKTSLSASILCCHRCFDSCVVMFLSLSLFLSMFLLVLFLTRWVLCLVVVIVVFGFQGISREGRHKRRETGGRRAKYRKKRKFEMGRPAANTRIGESRIHPVRGRGGNMKFRALRLDAGNFSWGTEVCTRKVRVLDVTYNASNNELVRTKTLVKGAIVVVDAHPFKSWYEGHYGVKIGNKKSTPESIDLSAVSKQIAAKFKKRQGDQSLEPALDNQFASGRLLAKVTSRPGQTGRCDGYILEGKELTFYQKAMSKK